MNVLLVLLFPYNYNNIEARIYKLFHRRQSWGLEVSRPQILSWGVVGGRREVVGRRGQVVKYYYNSIMYRKYVRKWRLVKRNRITCQEVAVNGQFFLDKRKKRSFGNFCLEKSIFFYPDPRPHPDFNPD